MRALVILLVVIVSPVLGLGACALPRPDSAVEAVAEAPRPHEGKSLIYLIAKKRWGGSGLYGKFYVDDRYWGKLNHRGTYLAGVFQPGRHKLTMKTEAVSVFKPLMPIANECAGIGLREGLSTSVELIPGNVHYIGVTSFSSCAGNHTDGLTIYSIAPEHGRELVREYQLSGDNALAHTLERGADQPVAAVTSPAPEVSIAPDSVGEQQSATSSTAPAQHTATHTPDETEALGDYAQPRVETASQFQPPRITIHSPKTDTVLRSRETKLVLAITDDNLPIKRITVDVNGRRVAQRNVRGLVRIPDSSDVITHAEGVENLADQLHRDLSVLLQLDEGENFVTVVASNGYSEAVKPLRLRVNSHPQRATTQLLPRLWVLAIGVNEYSDSRLSSLSYAATDAQGIVNALERQQGRLFREVNSRIVSDQAAIKPTFDNIIDNLEFLHSAAQNDVIVLFLAGHGVNDARGEFYFLPRDAVIKPDGSIRKSRAISWEQLNDAVDVPSKKIILADTCHSEGLSGRQTRAANNDALVRALKKARAVVFTSSTGTELSQEGANWGHGAFTYALLEGLEGEADLVPDGKISMKELDTYVSEAVPRLTGGSQHPITYTPEGYIDFPVALVP